MSSVGRLEEALQAALSYLLFHKGEEFVTENVEYYREVLGHDGEPREVSIRCRQVCFYVTMPSRVLSNITNNTALKQRREMQAAIWIQCLLLYILDSLESSFARA